MIFVEDDVEIESTLSHHIALGFQSVLVFLPDTFPLSADLADKVQRINFDATLPDQVFGAINQVIDAAPVGTWLYYCYNAEYLFFPFCETRSVRELLTFHSEERRDAMMTYVVDLYARDLAKNPDAVSRSESCLDRHGYYALTRWDNESKRPLDRQMDFFGGLRWRFEEHVPWQSRRIDRISLFRSRKNLTLLANHTFDEPEYNTVSCPWHNNLTATVCSFRVAKALRRNPGSSFAIDSFEWQNSTKFEWQSRQLMDLGLMEPGQWF